MTRAGLKKRIWKCKYKTNKGNVFDNYSDAKLAADNMGKWKKIFVEPYYCDVCKIPCRKGLQDIFISKISGLRYSPISDKMYMRFTVFS